MATPAELLTSIDAGITACTAAIASGNTITEWEEGPIRVKKSSTADLLTALMEMRKHFAHAGATDRRAAAAFYGGRL